MKKHDGNITFWATGFMAIILTISIVFLMMAHEKINQINASIEDIITSSALSAAILDRDRYAITGDIYINDNQECLSNYEAMFAFNEGINDFNSVAEVSGDNSHPYIDFLSGNIKILKFIVYNIPKYPQSTGDFIGEQYTYQNQHWASLTTVNYGNLSTTKYIKDPLNNDIMETSIYVEMEIPIKLGFFGIKGTITKAQTVAIQHI